MSHLKIVNSEEDTSNVLPFKKSKDQYSLLENGQVVFNTQDKSEMISFMKQEINKDHPRFVDMILVVNEKVSSKTIFLLGS